MHNVLPRVSFRFCSKRTVNRKLLSDKNVVLTGTNSLLHECSKTDSGARDPHNPRIESFFDRYHQQPFVRTCLVMMKSLVNFWNGFTMLKNSIWLWSATLCNTVGGWYSIFNYYFGTLYL